MVAAFMCVVLAQTPTSEGKPDPAQLRFFETKVRPLLAEKCFKCHGDEKQWGGLRLDSREAVARGGESGAAVVPGKPETSLLIEVIRQDDEDLRMPKGGQLTPRQIANLVRWVEMGAPFPPSKQHSQRTRDPNHWAFQPVVSPRLPQIANTDWPQTPIDHFVLARLESKRIEPTSPADKRTLIRRVTFDLHGLPPTPEEVAAFLADESPRAYVRVVDRLLASPRYGERWGRHWLDVARYADSNGFDENVAHGNAWRYRDYVVSALNADRPFDRFLTEQLAGDLLPFATERQQHDQLIATGFLSIGPKVLAETDQAKMRMDIVDEQIDTVGRSFLGLTLGCARCHDHKFDPIATADYYGLAGIFKSTLTMTKYTKVAEWHEHLLPSAAATAMQADFDAKVTTKQTAIDELIATANVSARKQLGSASDKPTQQQLEAAYPEETSKKLKQLRDELAALKKEGPNLPSAMGVTEDKIVDVPVHIRGDTLKLGDVVPRRTPAVVRGPQPPQFTAEASGRRQLADWLVDSANPLTSRVFVNRVWRWHFGRGLVPSMDNFGALGERPSHPQLLDWLAARFVADGWSIKSLHRLIVMSSTYRQASVARNETLASDPENGLFSRAPVRRLEAEAARDALLAVGGQLDLRMGGSLLKLKNRAYFFDHTSKDLTTYDSRRRSVYLPVVRNNVYGVFQLLDFPDPAVTTGDRASTVVASQALLMMNSDLVMNAAAGLAEHLVATSPDDESRLTRLYAIAFSREPSPAERQADLTLLARLSQPSSDESTTTTRDAWTSLCHVALAANEFLYLR